MLGPILTGTQFTDKFLSTLNQHISAPTFNRDFYTCKYCDHIKMGKRNFYSYCCSLIRQDIEIISSEYRTPDKCPLMLKTIRKRKLNRLNRL